MRTAEKSTNFFISPFLRMIDGAQLITNGKQLKSYLKAELNIRYLNLKVNFDLVRQKLDSQYNNRIIRLWLKKQWEMLVKRRDRYTIVNIQVWQHNCQKACAIQQSSWRSVDETRQLHCSSNFILHTKWSIETSTNKSKSTQRFN